jgi:hypothetical protein
MDCLLIKKDILAALIYFDLFNYPLKKDEIFSFLSQCKDRSAYEAALNGLIEDCLIFSSDGNFYSIADNPALSGRRILGNEKASSLLKKADRAGLLISFFPFVKGVAVSGSLSKNFADDGADVDFFIITASDRLWIARSCLHMLKKLTFLFNRQDLFCMNYFIDESNLMIREKNIFTAIEIATLLPLRGKQVFERFFHENNWVKVYFPNSIFNYSRTREMKRNPVTSCIQWLFKGNSGDRLDSYLMNLTAKRWNAKTTEGKKNKKGLVMSMGVGKHFSKPDPEKFQKRLLNRYEKKLAENFKWFEMSGFF